MPLRSFVFCVISLLPTMPLAENEKDISVLDGILENVLPSQALTTTSRIDSFMMNVAAALPTHVTIADPDQGARRMTFGNIDASVDITLSAKPVGILRPVGDTSSQQDARLVPISPRATLGDAKTLVLGASLDTASNTAVLDRTTKDRGIVAINSAISLGDRDAGISISASGYDITTGTKSTSVTGAMASGTNVIRFGPSLSDASPGTSTSN